MPIISWQKTMIIKTFIKDKQNERSTVFLRDVTRKEHIVAYYKLYELRRLIRTAFGGAFFMNNDSI